MSRGRLPQVAIVGRPNVGKSTLFNRVIGRIDAVVDDMPGVTRDRREAEAGWGGVRFVLVDTGGLVPGTQDSMEKAILQQAQAAMETSDVILFLVDGRSELTGLDREIAQALRPRVDHVLLVANKVDGARHEAVALEASELGLDTPWMISAQHGLGTGDLLEAVIRLLPRKDPQAPEDRAMTFTLVGRPNVGKSSLANRLLGEPRLIVHDEAGTTRDAIDVPFRYDGEDYVLNDTAGLRRRSHVATGVEYYSTLRTRKSLERSDVGVLVLDASQPISTQDARIASMIIDLGKSTLIAWNKWDLVEKDTGSMSKFTRDTHDKFPLLSGSPCLFVSAVTGQRVSRIPPTVRALCEERRKEIPTSRLNEVLEEATARVQPNVRANGKPLRFFYATQTRTAPPGFTIFTNGPRDVTAAYKSYLRNVFQQTLGLEATPIRLSFRGRRK